MDILIRGHTTNGRFVHANIFGHISENERAKVSHAKVEEVPLKAGDRFGHLAYGVLALVNGADQPERTAKLLLDEVFLLTLGATGFDPLFIKIADLELQYQELQQKSQEMALEFEAKIKEMALKYNTQLDTAKLKADADLDKMIMAGNSKILEQAQKSANMFSQQVQNLNGNQRPGDEIR